MMTKLGESLERVTSWPDADQEELAEYAEHIESRLGKGYQATTEELQALDEADRSGVASEEEVESAFQAFRHHA
jgi:hypothetical protein